MMMLTARAWLAVLGAACVVAGTIGAMMVYVAIDHNPQGEFVDTQTGLSEIFLSWLVVVGVVVGLLLALVVSIVASTMRD